MNQLSPQAKPHHPVNCNCCGFEFPQDPPFEVACPTCKAPPASYCRRPSGHSGPLVPFHAERDLLALKEGYYDHPGKEGCGPNSDTDRAYAILKKFHKT